MMPIKTCTDASGMCRRRCNMPDEALSPPKSTAAGNNAQRMMPRDERHQDARKAVPGEHRGIRLVMDGGDFDHAGQPGRGPAEETRHQDQQADRQSGGLRRADIAAGHAGGKAERRVIHQDPREHAGHDAVRQAPVDVHAEHRAQHGRFRDRIGRRLVQARRIAHRSFDQKIEDVDGDSTPAAGSKSSRSRRANAAVRRTRAISKPPATMPATAMPSWIPNEGKAVQQQGRFRGRQAAQGQRPFAADDDQSQPRGKCGAQGGQNQRGGPRQRVLPRKARAEAADVHPIEQLGRRHAGESRT